MRVPISGKVEAKRQQRIAARRQQIMNMLREDPTLNRKQLDQKAPTIIQEIRKFDPEWLNQTVPLIKYPSPLAIDWGERDQNLAQRIPSVVKTIQAEPGKPVRITKAEIGRRMGATNWFANDLHKLPKTKTALDAVLESREAFAIRRLIWAKDYFVQ